MTSDVLIRVLEQTDAEAFRDLRLEALTVAPEAFGASYEEEASIPLEAMRAHLSTSPNVVFGAFADHALIGVAGFAVHDRVKARHRGVLWGVYMKAEWRGHQVGKRLVQCVIDHACRHVIMLEAVVGLTNDSARSTYHGLGFRPYGVQRKALRVGDTFYDEELLYLDLPQSEDA
ncbi:GNAT family N-acetyltransferase [Microvirga terrestris]|uniref:GNAT family N-acetyltransferase n=1 Tax=Microvirga terrestris TaxID=2791024 RepID=A0ABS0HMU3_9HYPH|nr:GNAT family N-acetyltransferase [Microvirga terrestris]MBF9194773.1 GNAT family N-acetyltransferase [Microvirga terrestris]